MAHGATKRACITLNATTNATVNATTNATSFPGYRAAWDDCGGAGASATERMRGIAAGIKGFAKDVPFVRHAGQDCGSVQADGLKPGPGSGVVYPGPKTWQAATNGLMTADLALEKFGSK